MSVNRAGIFRATIADKAVAPKGKNKLVAFQASFNLLEELSEDSEGNQSYFDIASEGMKINKDFYLEKKDGGGLSEHTVGKLKEALGWDGKDPFWLEDSLPADTVVKLTIEFDEPTDPKYKPKLDVKWLDHKDAIGVAGIVRASDADKSMIRNRLGPKLRAINGGTPATKPPAPAGKPTLPPPVATATAPASAVEAASTAVPATATPPAAPSITKRTRKAPSTPAPTLPTTATMEEAWAEYTRGIATGQPPQGILDQWENILVEMFPDKDDDTMTGEDWHRVKIEAPAKYVPF